MFAFLVPALLMSVSLTAQAASELPLPPAAKKVAKELVAHGEKRIDNYFWLREKENPAVIEHLKTENAYTDAVMKALAGFRESLYKELLSRIKETDESVPYQYRGWWYYTREVEGKQYPIYCRRKGTMESPEQVMLDVNELAEGKSYTSVDFWEVSPDGNYLAYGVDFTGYREYTVFIKDLRTGALHPDRIEKVRDLAWAADSETIFYLRENASKRVDKLYRHRLGQAKDPLLFEEKDELFNLHLASSRSGAWIVVTSHSKDTSEVRVIPSVQPQAPPRLILKRKTGHEYYVDHRGQEFWIRTNDQGKNFRVVRAPVADPSPANWRPVLPHRKDVMIERVDLFQNFWVATERDDGLLKLRVTDFKSGAFHHISMPEAVYSTGPGTNMEFDAPLFRFEYQSYITPRTTYDYNVAKRERTLLKQQPVLGGYKPEEYESAMIFAPAKDGTKIPVSLVWKKSLRKLGEPQPMLLYGYGSYGIPMDIRFRATRLSLLDRGAIFAVAHIRGGGDRGRLWYEDGKLGKKMNTFTDFIAAAEFLQREKWTSSDRVVIQGGSAGGLLVGAVSNLAPQLFRAVVSEVPFVDVISTMQDATLPLTTEEYIEWGNPAKEKEYRWMRAYSPYDNLQAKAYPAMLVETSLNDSQVPYWEAAKYVAKLRELKTDKNLVLLKTTMEAGHGGASGRYDSLKELAFTMTFILDQLGLAK